MAVNPLLCLTCVVRQRTHLLASFLTAVSCSLFLLGSPACERAQARRDRNLAEGDRRPPAILKLTDEQIAFIEKNAPKGIAWQAYWTWDHPELNPFYVANAGKKVPAKYISFEHALIVWINEIRIVSVAYVKMPDGSLDYPASVTSAAGDVDDLLKAGSLRPSNWDAFLMMLDYYPELRLVRQEKDGYETQFPSPLKRALARHEAGQQKNEYDTQLTSPNPHWVTDAEITLPELGPPSYEPMSETKELLLARILKESQHQADTMFEKHQNAIITVPDFNIGEPGIQVLIQDEKGGGVIVAIQLTTKPREHPVFFGGVVTYDITANRYGLGEEAQAARMIREHALKKIAYTPSNR